jgi:Tol biopolymer transport system component
MAYSSALMTTNIQKLALDPAAGSVTSEPVWVTTGSRLWSSPDPSPDGQWVVFYSQVQPEGDLYVVRSDGTGQRPVTSDAALDRVPRWSPDGKWIAYFSDRGGSIRVWKVRPDGSELQQLSDAGSYVAWSPDGSRLAISVATTVERNRTFIMDPSKPEAHQTPQALPSLESPRALFLVNSWSPDGERLAGYSSGAATTTGIVTYSLRTGTYERLTNFGEWPVWLPDSRHLLFGDGGKNFWLVDSQTKQVRKIYSGGRDVLGPPRLTRDGRHAFYSRRVTEADIWLMTLK